MRDQSICSDMPTQWWLMVEMVHVMISPMSNINSQSWPWEASAMPYISTDYVRGGNTVPSGIGHKPLLPTLL